MIHGIYAIIDLKVVTGDLHSITEEVIEGGANIIQLRAKEVSTKEFLRAGTSVNKVCKSRGIPFIINDRVDIAIAIDSDGVHLGQDDMPINQARSIMPEGKLIGLSIHSLSEAENAVVQKPDYVGIGPVFFTRTKKDAVSPIGIEIVRKVKRKMNIPVVAIGGINGQNIKEVLNSGADAAAVCTAIFGAVDITSATQKLVSQFNSIATS